MNNYLFIDDNNGHKEDIYPFETDMTLTQEIADQLMLQEQPAARRIGARIQHLEFALNKKGHVCRPIKYLGGDEKIIVIRCISGNY